MFLVIFITGGQQYSSNHFNKRDLVIKNIGKTPEFHLIDFFECGLLGLYEVDK